MSLYRCSSLPKALPKGPLAAGCHQSQQQQMTINSKVTWLVRFVGCLESNSHQTQPVKQSSEQSSSEDPNIRPSQFSMCFIAPSRFWIPSPHLIYLESPMKTP